LYYHDVNAHQAVTYPWAFKELKKRLRAMEYGQATLETAQTHCKATEQRQIERERPDVETAAHYVALRRMSRGGLGRSLAWSERLRGGRPGDLNSWETMITRDIDRIHDRFWKSGKPVLFLQMDIIDIANQFLPLSHCAVYFDPPYVHSTRKHWNTYEIEMQDSQHASLLMRARAAKAAVAISGYVCPMYANMLCGPDALREGWNMRAFDLPNNSGQTKTKERRTECIFYRASIPN
jgi:hypothetical protein